jgi:hypothetical protein
MFTKTWGTSTSKGEVHPCSEEDGYRPEVTATVTAKIQVTFWVPEQR